MRRSLQIAAILAGSFTYMMVLVGLSFALIEQGTELWAVVPLVGAVIAVVAMFAIRRLLPRDRRGRRRLLRAAHLDVCHWRRRRPSAAPSPAQ